MKLGLKDRVVMVTGASRGIGKAIALGFAAEGSKVVINARGEQDLKDASSALSATGAEVLAVRADLTKSADVDRLVAEALSRFGAIDVLVNNCGGASKFAEFDDLSDEDWLGAMELNLFSAVRVTRAVLPHMQRRKWGRVINISSESGVQPDRQMPHYNASKAALNNLTKSLSKAYAMDGILVNTVSPALTATERMTQTFARQAQAKGIEPGEAEAQFVASFRPHMELKRAGRGEEVAAAVVFLASETASFITGANLRVDGGSVASM